MKYYITPEGYAFGLLGFADCNVNFILSIVEKSCQISLAEDQILNFKQNCGCRHASGADGVHMMEYLDYNGEGPFNYHK